MANIAKLVPGQVLYTVSRTRMGNTTISTVATHPVKVLEVHADHIIASWNGNAARSYSEFQVSKWKTTKPIMVESRFGSRRLATAAEKKALKEAAQKAAEAKAANAEPKAGVA